MGLFLLGKDQLLPRFWETQNNHTLPLMPDNAPQHQSILMIPKFYIRISFFFLVYFLKHFFQKLGDSSWIVLVLGPVFYSTGPHYLFCASM